MRSSTVVLGGIFVEKFQESTRKTGFGTFKTEELLSFWVILERLLADPRISNYLKLEGLKNQVVSVVFNRLVEFWLKETRESLKILEVKGRERKRLVKNNYNNNDNT